MSSEVGKIASKKEAQNFGINEATFNDMLVELRQGEEALFEQIFLSHIKDCIQFLMRQYQATHEAAYDASLDTLLEFRRRLLDGKVQYGNMRFLFTKMAGQVLLKQKGKIKTTNDLTLIERLDEEGVDEEALQLLDKAWNQLETDCSQLLKAFYYQKQQLKAIAERLTKSEAALRKQKQRCLEKLRSIYMLLYNQ